MHFVAALDDVPAMRGVLCLFEGVATGAADGYGRVAGRPAATLLHLGPGLGNGLANLHNARRARTPVVNIVGDHATSHERLRRAAPVGHRVDGPRRVDRSSARRSTAGGRDAARALAAAAGPPAAWPPWSCPPTLVVRGGLGRAPADGSSAPSLRCLPDEAVLEEVAKALRSGRRALRLLLGGSLPGQGPARRSAESPARPAPPCWARPSRPAWSAVRAGPVERLAYLAEMAQAQLDGVRQLVLVDAKSPVSFFAYPDKASDLVPAGCTRARVARPGEDVDAALEALGRGGGRAAGGARRAEAERPARPPARSTAATVARPSGPPCPRAPSSRTRATGSGFFAPGATAGAPRTTGSR